MTSLLVFIVMLPMALLTLESRMPGSKWVPTPSWLSGSLRSFFGIIILCILATSSLYHLLLLGPYHFCPLLCPSLHWRRQWQTTSAFLPWEPHEPYEKAKGYETERWTPKAHRCPICYCKKVETCSRWNEGAEAKQKQCSVVDVSGGESKVQFCKKKRKKERNLEC